MLNRPTQFYLYYLFLRNMITMQNYLFIFVCVYLNLFFHEHKSLMHTGTISDVFTNKDDAWNRVGAQYKILVNE